jgi:hypothetical protein
MGNDNKLLRSRSINTKRELSDSTAASAAREEPLSKKGRSSREKDHHNSARDTAYVYGDGAEHSGLGPLWLGQGLDGDRRKEDDRSSTSLVESAAGA